MDQKKIGSFLRELRKEQEITQEQLAEKLNVSGRTISRWETGRSMPDISLLSELAEFFGVSIPEIINGERKSEKMNEEVKEVAEKLSDYALAEKETIIKQIRSISIPGVCALAVYGILDYTGLCSQNELFEKIYLYCQTLVFVTVILVPIYATGGLNKIQRKHDTLFHTLIGGLPKPVRIVVTAIIVFGAAVVLKLILVKIFGILGISV
jgi:transcriptional regulator with XRE-family HTH domain